MKNILIAILALIALVVPAYAEDAPAPPTVLYPNTTFAFPAKSRLAVQWIIPPLDAAKVAEAYHTEPYAFNSFFTVDGAGQPWVYRAGALLNLLKGYKVAPDNDYPAVCCTENGAMFLVSDDELSIPIIPATLQLDYANLPKWSSQPLTALPFAGGNVVAGGGNALYHVGCNPANGQWEVNVLCPEPSAAGKLVLHGFRTVFSSPVAITAVGGDGTVTYVAINQRLLKIAHDKVTLLPCALRDGDTFLQLVGSAKAGLFYTTKSGVGYLGDNGQLTFLTTPYPQIALRGDDLYVLFTGTLGVVKISGVSDLSTLPLTVATTAAADSTQIKISPLTFFEGPEKVPDEATLQFATTFARATTRYIYGHLNINNLQYEKKDVTAQQHVIEMRLYGRNGEQIDTNSTPCDLQPDMASQTVTLGFGNAEPDSWFPGVYTVKVMLDGLQVDAKSFTITGKPTLFEAAIHCDAPTVEQLLRDKADPNVSTDDATPLLVAVLQQLSAATTSPADVTRVAQALVAAGADVNAADATGQTALMYAYTPQLAAFLLDHGAKYDAVTNDGQTPLHRLAFTCGDGNGLPVEQAMKVLLDHGAAVDARDKAGHTPLRMLVDLYGTPAGMALLLDHGADINAADNEGQTALSCLVSQHFDETDNRFAMIRLLLDRHASLQCPLTQGKTEPDTSLLYEALTHCAYSNTGDAEVVRMLSDHGAWLKPSEESLVVMMEYLQYLPSPAVRRLLESDNGLREALDELAKKPGWQPVLLAALQAKGRALAAQATNAGDYQHAWEYLQKALTLAENNHLTAQYPEVYLNCSLLSRAMGNSADADTYLARYTEITTAKKP